VQVKKSTGDSMDKRSRQRVVIDHLRREDAQERIMQKLQKGRAEATVTISRAAELFDLSENRLRDWEEHGFLSPQRPTGPKGRRLYTPGELDKLAIIRELIDAGYGPSDIPANVDKLFYSLLNASDQHVITDLFDPTAVHGERSDSQVIDQRLSKARGELFLRFYVAHVLRMALMIICEDLPDTTAALILPLHARNAGLPVQTMDDLANVGEAIVGWLGRSHSSHTLITALPSFQYSTDYRVLPLAVMRDDHPEEEARDNTLLLLDRRANPLTLNAEVVELVRRMLAPLYEDAELLKVYLGSGMRDSIDPATDFASSANYYDVILNGLTDMIVRLGGKQGKENRWRFSCCLLPKDLQLPLPQRTLVIRAQSAQAPYKLGVTMITPEKYADSPSIRALQSGHIVHLSRVLPSDTSIAYRDLEGPIRSALAVPVGGEEGLAIAVIYVTSFEENAFQESDLRILRIMARMVEEVLRTYQVRQQVTQRLGEMLRKPSLIDTFFESFLSEGDFIRDVEEVLSGVQMQIKEREQNTGEDVVSVDRLSAHGEEKEPIISFISVDIDKESSLANKYGDRIARNLTREVGLRIQEQLRTFFKEYPYCQLYHAYADRFYIILKHIPLELARTCAERLRQGLIGSYKLDALRSTVNQSTRPDSMLELSQITVRLGVTSYSYEKIEEILSKHPIETAIVAVRAIITSGLVVPLDRGRDEGGNVVISWDTNVRGFIHWSPSK
jgi:DNA-binding transcriptional MerR regulator/GAF domain-containing protein/GGDEF domain-containing protein